MKRKILYIIIIIVMLFSLTGCLEDEVINNIGDKTFTLMVYICAADLESDGGYATNDIQEMLDGFVDEKVNLIIQTGGTSQWQDYDISSETIQRYQIKDNDLYWLENVNEYTSMTEPETLTDFINYAKTEFPADRYGLILWDHGGGSISGYGYDENNEDPDDTMQLDEIKSALQNAGVHMDFIGFDACLMATVENAFALKDSADYLLASEEIEPGTGWQYTYLLNQLSSNTDQETSELGKKIVDDFIDDNQLFVEFDSATLSLVDLSKIQNVYDKLCEFFKNVEQEDLQNEKEFSDLARVIEKTKSVADGEIDTIDLYNFAENENNSKSAELLNSLKEAIVYNNTTDSYEGSNGLSIYIPYTDLDYYSKMLTIYQNIGISEEYIQFLSKFANIVADGQTQTDSVMGQINEKEDYTNEQWYDSESSFDYSQNEYNDLEITDKGDYYALELSDEDWENIAYITCEVLYDYGEGRIDLGSDDSYEEDDEGNLKITFDNIWLTINDQPVAYYAINDESDDLRGTVPAYVNDNEVQLIVDWDENGNAKVIGYQKTNYGESTIQSKIKKLQKGDRIDFIYDNYDYNGEYDDSYTFDDTIIYDGKDLEVEYNDIGEGKYYVYYKIIDIYNNEYYTEPVEFE